MTFERQGRFSAHVAVFGSLALCAHVSATVSRDGMTARDVIGSSPTTWITNANGDWASAANWSNGVPNNPDAVARFGSALTSAHTITLSSPQTVGSVSFETSASVTVAGANALTLDVASGSAQLQVTAGQHSITAPILAANDTLATVAAGTQLRLSNVNAASHKLTKADAGRVIADRLVADTLDIQGGEFIPGASAPSKIKSLQVASGARLNLGSGGQVFVDYTGTSPLAAIRTMILDGRLLTTEINAAVGFGEASTLGVGTPTPDDQTSLYLASTFAGDATLDLAVGFDDLLRLARSYGVSGAKTWTDGDFNNDQAVNFDDLLLLARNYNKSSRDEATLDLPPTFAADWTLAQSLVPEPISAAVGAACLAAIRRARRRR